MFQAGFRDAIHAVATLSKNMSTIASDGPYFDVMRGLERISIEEFANKLSERYGLKL